MDLIHWVRSHGQFDTKIATGDAKCGTAVNIAGVEKAGIEAYLPIPDLSQRTPYYPATHYQYDAEQDQYICPQGQLLPLCFRRKSEQVFVFRVDAAAGQNLKRLLKK